MHSLKSVWTLCLMLAVGAFAQSKPTATLTASTPTFDYQLGSCVAMSGSTIAACYAGSVLVFTKAATAPWTDMTESAPTHRHLLLGSYLSR